MAYRKGWNGQFYEVPSGNAHEFVQHVKRQELATLERNTTDQMTIASSSGFSVLPGQWPSAVPTPPGADVLSMSSLLNLEQILPKDWDSQFITGYGSNNDSAPRNSTVASEHTVADLQIDSQLNKNADITSISGKHLNSEGASKPCKQLAGAIGEMRLNGGQQHKYAEPKLAGSGHMDLSMSSDGCDKILPASITSVEYINPLLHNQLKGSISQGSGVNRHHELREKHHTYARSLSLSELHTQSKTQPLDGVVRPGSTQVITTPPIQTNMEHMETVTGQRIEVNSTGISLPRVNAAEYLSSLDQLQNTMEQLFEGEEGGGDDKKASPTMSERRVTNRPALHSSKVSRVLKTSTKVSQASIHSEPNTPLDASPRQVHDRVAAIRTELENGVQGSTAKITRANSMISTSDLRSKYTGTFGKTTDGRQRDHKMKRANSVSYQNRINNRMESNRVYGSTVGRERAISEFMNVGNRHTSTLSPDSSVALASLYPFSDSSIPLDILQQPLPTQLHNSLNSINQIDKIDTNPSTLHADLSQPTELVLTTDNSNQFTQNTELHPSSVASIELLLDQFIAAGAQRTTTQPNAFGLI